MQVLKNILKKSVLKEEDIEKRTSFEDNFFDIIIISDVLSDDFRNIMIDEKYIMLNENEI